MNTRRLGSTDLFLTTIGLGTWAIGGPWDWGWGPQDDRESIRTIHRALDSGINWIDTAPCYGLGHSEEVVGRALAERSDSVLVATKCGLVWNRPEDRTTFARLKAKSVRNEVEESLRRLGLEKIDLYQIHWPEPEADIEEAFTEMARLVEEGKLRYIAVSNFSVEQIRRMRAIHTVASVQPPYSMLERGIEEDLLEYCRGAGIGVIVYSPMQAGLLTGSFSRERLEGLPADDWRRRNRHFRRELFSINLSFVERLRAVADEAGRSLAELSIAWVLRHDAVTSAIVGARSPDQVDGFISAGDRPLGRDEDQAIAKLLESREREIEARQQRPSGG